MPQMKATKSLTYGTRRLKADDIFTARTRTDARVLIALKKAEYYTEPKAAPKPKAAAKPKRAARTKTKPA